MDVVRTVKKKSLPLCSRNQLYIVTYFPSLRKIVTVMFQPCCLSARLCVSLRASITRSIWPIVVILGINVTALEATPHHNFQLPTINMAGKRTKLAVRMSCNMMP